MKNLLVVLSLIVLLVCKIAVCLDYKRNPIVLIPGFLESQLFATQEKKTTNCPTLRPKEFPLWFQASDILVLNGFNCTADLIKLDFIDGISYDREGVEVFTKDFGNTTTIESTVSSTDPIQSPRFDVFKNFVQYFIDKFGYVRGESILGAPYDWRKAPNELNDYYCDLTKLIEDAYTDNGNRKVVIVAHSLGNPVILVI
jgi:hypothetical protein